MPVDPGSAKVTVARASGLRVTGHASDPDIVRSVTAVTGSPIMVKCSGHYWHCHGGRRLVLITGARSRAASGLQRPKVKDLQLLSTSGPSFKVTPAGLPS